MKTIEKYRNSINKYLNKNLPKSGILSKAIRYSTIDGGKRIRSILCIASFRTCGGIGNKILPVVCAIELIHTFSLIHDDLPCMDNDDLRRGKPTSHRVFGEDIAILAGDALLTMAFEWIANCKGISNKKKITVIKELSSCVGPKGLIGGQVLDLKTPKQDLSPNAIKFIYMKKTAQLITTAIRVGAILASATRKKLTALTNYGKNLGLVFQIIDDILDLDKDKGISYARLFGKDKTLKYAKQLINQCIISLKPFGKKADLLEEIALIIFNQVKINT